MGICPTTTPLPLRPAYDHLSCSATPRRATLRCLHRVGAEQLATALCPYELETSQLTCSTTGSATGAASAGEHLITSAPRDGAARDPHRGFRCSGSRAHWSPNTVRNVAWCARSGWRSREVRRVEELWSGDLAVLMKSSSCTRASARASARSSYQALPQRAARRCTTLPAPIGCSRLHRDSDHHRYGRLRANHPDQPRHREGAADIRCVARER
jgi:hypothetical protein